MDEKKNPEELMKEFEEKLAKTAELNERYEKMIAEMEEQISEEDEVCAEENEDEESDEIEIHEDPDAWKKGLAVVGGLTALSFVGGLLTGIFGCKER
ncbi:MAG: hypothetical protein IJQ86_08230 [Spirochaetia bacterium]|nr:hypothetical protein [Spirochaetia bacterium]